MEEIPPNLKIKIFRIKIKCVIIMKSYKYKAPPGYTPLSSPRGIDNIYKQGGGCPIASTLYDTGPNSITLPPQAGGKITLKDIGKGLETAYNWARKNKPVKKLNAFIDKVVPANVKANSIYSGIRNATGVIEQAGFGQ